ncbi:MAG: ABC transporter ATP-binding protein [Pseudomonadota bacterium]
MTGSLSLHNVSKRFGDLTAVDNVSLDINDGEFVALLGASGCGKSTTLRLFAGLETPTDGRVKLDKKDVTDESASARNIALMFQSYALYPHLSVAQNIAMPLILRRFNAVQRLPGAGFVSAKVRAEKANIREAVNRMADLLRLNELLNRKPGQLSGGQQQRVALARALVRDPSAFLLDEPLSNLDTQLRAETREEIKAIHKRTGYPFLLVTHDQSDALSMADRVAVMMEGRIVQSGTPTEIFNTPATQEVATFIGHHRMNILPPGAGTALHPDGANLALGIRPEEFSLTKRGGLQATVESVTFHGEETILRLRGPDDLSLRSALRGHVKVPEVGAKVRLTASNGSLHAFGADGVRQELAQ